MEVGPERKPKRRSGELTRLDAVGPPPDEATRPEAGACAECGRDVEAVWLPISKRPRWHAPRLCDNCAEIERRAQEAERRRKLAQRTLQERIRRAGLASPHRAARTFERFERVPGTETALARAAEFARRMSEDPDAVTTGMLFVGVNAKEPNGCGKTHLALAILHEVLASDVARTGLFVQFADYLDALKRSFGAGTEDGGSPEWVRYAMFEVELLVLDDIGSAATSRGGWDSEEMCRLLNHRIEMGRPIIATADVGPEELAAKLGRRVVSRLYEACEVVRIEAGDYRMPRS